MWHHVLVLQPRPGGSFPRDPHILASPTCLTCSSYPIEPAVTGHEGLPHGKARAVLVQSDWWRTTTEPCRQRVSERPASLIGATASRLL